MTEPFNFNDFPNLPKEIKGLGELGFLAGDHIKEASDLRIPLVAVGFMYPEGYLKQQIQEDGWQESVAEDFDREAAPISNLI